MSDGGMRPDDPAFSIGPADLDAAVAAGVIGADAATALAAFAAARERALPAADEEAVRFVTSFNDVFVTLGIALLVGAVVVLGFQFAPIATGPAVAVLAWGLAEIFTARRRMAFPSIVLVALFVAACGGSVVTASGGGGPFVAVGAGLAMLIGGYVHWRRFGVPISVAAAVAGAIAMVVGILAGVARPFLDAYFGAVCLVFGLAVFALAMKWDLSDLERRTRRTDTAFWLHVLAAPLIVHPLASLLGAGFATVSGAAPALILAMFAAIAIVAVVVDRRALLVSALAYFGGSILVLIRGAGWVGSIDEALTVGVVGAVVLGLSVAWAPLRAVVLQFVPAAVRAVVPAPRVPRGQAS